MPRGKTPSLIGGSLGKPVATTAGRRCSCSRCDATIAMSEACFDIPQPSKKFQASRRFCRSCYREVLAQTRKDLEKLEAPPSPSPADQAEQADDDCS